MTTWTFAYDGFDPENEDLREALHTLGNGYFATRGAAAESDADGIHYPGTYLAGGYNRLKTEIAGREIENEDLVNLPNWLPLTFRIGNGEWFDLSAVEILHYRQELDIKRGLLLRNLRFRDVSGRVTLVENRRLVHMGDPHLAAQETTITPQNWSGRVEIRSALDGRVVNAGVERYRSLNGRHLEPLEAEATNPESLFLLVRTSQSRLDIALAARTRAFRNGQVLNPQRVLDREKDYVAHRFGLEALQGERITLEKVVSLFTSRDHGISQSGLAAREALSSAGSFQTLLESHVLAWEHLWRRFKIDFEPHDPAMGDRTGRIIHLYTFHLLQTTSLHTKDLDVGVPSRGWHGEAYRGHIFWDELFIFPLLNLRIPEITRALLMYSYRRLGAARRAAKNAGFQGAMYPWQSGSNGREETQQLHLNPKSGRWLPDNSHLQRHISAAVAYNLWQYYQITGDMEFLSFYGAEMLLEIARFWASVCRYNEELGRYEILGVMGPDEYHDAYPGSGRPGLDKHPYPNLLAVWCLNRAVDEGGLPRGRHHQPVRGLRKARGVRLAGLPGEVRRHPEAGPHPGGRGGHAQPLQGLQAGRRADAFLPVLFGGTEGDLRQSGLPLRVRDDPQERGLLSRQDFPRIHPEQGRPLLGPDPLGSGPLLGTLHDSPGERRGRYPGRDHAGRHPPGRHGRYGRSPPSSLHGHHRQKRYPLV